jgi:hypothetical protein
MCDHLCGHHLTLGHEQMWCGFPNDYLSYDCPQDDQVYLY